MGCFDSVYAGGCAPSERTPWYFEVLRCFGGAANPQRWEKRPTPTRANSVMLQPFRSGSIRSGWPMPGEGSGPDGTLPTRRRPMGLPRGAASRSRWPARPHRSARNWCGRPWRDWGTVSRSTGCNGASSKLGSEPLSSPSACIRVLPPRAGQGASARTPSPSGTISFWVPHGALRNATRFSRMKSPMSRSSAVRAFRSRHM